MADKVKICFEKRFADGPVIRPDFNLPLDQSSVTVLFGPSGSGKSTVLRCLAGLTRPDEGHINYGEEPWFDAANHIHWPAQKRRIGLLFQEYALFPHLTVEQNVAYGLWGRPESERTARVESLLRLLRIDDLHRRYPNQLSGGQKQRVALARAVAPNPRLLCLDEPLSALDAPTRERLRVDLRRVLREIRIPTLLVTHDRTEALSMADRMAVLIDGAIAQVGGVEEVFNRPASLAVAQAVGTETVASGRVVSQEGSIVQIDVSGTTVCAVSDDRISGPVFVCIRAEDVILEKEPAWRVSARNQLQGRVTAVDTQGALFRVSIDVGFPLHAGVTKNAVEELGLAPGCSAVALIKAPAIHVIQRSS